jgi:pyruvate,water dikinase
MRTLHGIGLALERVFQGGQDIEWTINREGQLQIVQSRPITGDTLHSPPPSAAAGRPVVVWSNANINENYPDPVSPFLYSVATDGYYHYFRNLALALGVARSRIVAMDPVLRNIIGAHGARLYYNLTNLHAALRMAPLGDRLVDAFNLFVGTRECPAPSPNTPRFGDRRTDRVAQIAEAIWIATKTAWQFLFLTRRVAAFERVVDEYAQQTHPEGLASRSLHELHGALRSFLDIRCHRWTEASLADAAAMIGYGALQGLVRRAMPDGETSVRHHTLLQGLPNLASAEPVTALWALSRRIRSDPALCDLFTAATSEEIWHRLHTDSRFTAFLHAVEEYLDKWGFRCSGELLLTVPSFQEDPRGILAVLKTYATLDGESPVAVLGRQAEERLRATQQVLRALRRRRLVPGLFWPHEGGVMALVLRRTQDAIALRERARLKQALLYSRCRRVLLRIGEELVAHARLDRREDVFFLTHQELDTLLAGGAMFPDQVGAVVALRRQGHVRLGASQPPETLVLSEGAYLSGRENSVPPGTSSPPRDEAGVLHGIGACGGRVVARARVLTDVAEAAHLRAGEVLVTRQTDPGWAPVFFLISGLVIERGGMLSHGAILAREYGIPTVVGVPEATRRIPSGRTVVVDADKGRVQLVG